MSVKLLISGESNAGKTTLTKSLTNALVISHDGKKYGFPIPHITVKSFNSVSDLVTLINDKIRAYKTKFKEYPKTIVFDSVSKIFDTMLNNCNDKYSGFKIYSELDKEITLFTSYIENTIIASNMNVVLISHAIYDAEISKYTLVGKGSFAKRGGFLAETEQALFLESKPTKRLIHFRSAKFPARTLHEDDPDYVDVKDFNLQSYIDKLSNAQDDVDEFEL